MPDPWAIDVYTPAGVLRRTLTPNDPVADFMWSLRGDGDCMEAEIRGVALDIRPREIVVIRTVIAGGGDTLSPRYIGWVVETPNRRHTDVTSTHLVGGSKRLTEVLVRPFQIDEVDVARMARDAANNAATSAIPFLAVAAANSTDFPDTTFQLGVRYPQLETVAEALSAMSAAVPGFTVLPSTTYVYDGVTYQPGDEVPPAMWGVRVATGPTRGAIYFRRPKPDVSTLDEIADALTIDWQALSSERIVDDVTIIVIEQRTGVVMTPVHKLQPIYSSELMPPITRRFTRAGSPYGAQLRVGAEGNGLKAGTWDGAAILAGFTDTNNAWDDNVLTYAYNPAGWPVGLARRASASTVACRIRYSSVVPVAVRLERDAGRITETLGNTSGEQQDVLLVAPDVGDPPNSSNVLINIQLPLEAADAPADAIRIYEVTPLEVDDEVLERLASSYFTPPPDTSTAAVVTVPNKLLPPAYKWAITLSDSQVVKANAERIEYAIDTQRGLTTTLYLGQALSATEVSARALLDSNITRAVLAGKRGQL
jgi:hypothetical protein